MSSAKVALAGATGNLGGPILQALLDAGRSVTVLSRMGGNASRLTPHPNLTVKEVDFTSVASLTPALLGSEAVVSCVATLAIDSQNPLIDASVAAGVKRFVPAEFGMDSANRLCVQQLPVGASKAAVQEYLNQKSRENPWFTWTAVANGLFLDWCLRTGLILDLAQHTAILYNGGDVPFSTTKLSGVAAAVLGIVRHQPQTANRVVYIQSARVTQNQLIRYAREVDGKDWTTSVKDTEELRKEGLAELAKGPQGNVDAAMLGFSYCATMSADYGCDYSGHLDNELLGVKELDEAEVRALVASLL